MRSRNFEREFEERLKGATKIVVMAVGDELDPRDCAGVLAGKRIAAAKLKGVKVLQTSQMPENYTSVVRRENPSHVVIIDAADMRRSPGDVALIEPGEVTAIRVSTHAMPLSVLMHYIREELGISVLLLGIQPDEPGDDMAGRPSRPLEKGIDRIVSALEDTASSGASPT